MVRSRRTGSRSGHSYSDYRRLSPDENEREGFSRKARRYVLKSVRRLTRRTPTISARAHETLRARQEYGFPKPELATQARQHGALSYKTAAARETAAKASSGNVRKRTARIIREVVAAGGSIPNRSPHAKTPWRLKSGDDARLEAVIQRHNEYLAGEKDELSWSDWLWAMDVLDAFNDPRAAYFRQSGGAFGIAA